MSEAIHFLQHEDTLFGFERETRLLELMEHRIQVGQVLIDRIAEG